MKRLVLILLLTSCHQAEFIPNNCGVNNPLKDLSWLRKLDIDNGTGSSIIQGTYQGQTVYAVSSCGRCFNGSYVAVYHCDGSIICRGMGLDRSSTGCSQLISGLTDTRILVEHKP